MLAFIDESGLPTATGELSQRPVVVAVCFDEAHSREITGQIYDLQRRLLRREVHELKGQQLLSRSEFRRRPDSREFAASFFDWLSRSRIIVFAIIMAGPFEQRSPRNGRLETRFRFLLERIDLLAAEREAYANVIFDGDSWQLGGLSKRFSEYLFQSEEGRAIAHITDTPVFADSLSSLGIQMADMCAHVIRVYEENRLFSPESSPLDEYLSAIRRWHYNIECRTRTMVSRDDHQRRGIYRLPRGRA